MSNIIYFSIFYFQSAENKQINKLMNEQNSRRHKEVEYLHDFSLPFEDQVMWYQRGLLAAAAQRCFSAN